jgi:single-strand DNA-binding protein
MPSLNKVILVGRLTRDPEMRYTSSGLAVTNFTIAVDRRAKNQQGERQTDFFRCNAWRQTAEFVANYLTKGRLVAVEGRIELNEYTGQDGQKKFSTDIVCDHVEGLDSSREGGQEGAGGMGGAPRGAAPQAGGHDDYNAEYSAGPAGGNAGGGNAGGDNGYFPDDDMGTAPRGGNMAGNRPAPAARPAAPQNRAPGGAPPRPAQTVNRQPARPAQPAYPADDFDDSDPFADE